MTANPLKMLPGFGQSVWYDFIRRDMMTSGELDRLIEEDGLRGMTTNPAIFQSAIGQGSLYDQDIVRAGLDLPAQAIFEAIAVEDVQMAADRFRPVYDATNALDGYVSIEVEPDLAYDTEASIASARRLWAACDRPNVMIKIPGTAEGLPAIQAALEEGINVNITLLFGVERYIEVMDVWFAAMENRQAAGKSVANIASVASFFVSRVDSMIDAQLEGMGDNEEAQSAMHAMGVGNARLAYRAFEERFRTDRFERLAAEGAIIQRPLWASTSTKNPDLPDTLYVETLIGEDTVNTMPPATYDAYRDHGAPAVRVRAGLPEAEEAQRLLASLGVELPLVTRKLEEEGVEKFVSAFQSLLTTIREKSDALKAA
jgi:transaldolase